MKDLTWKDLSSRDWDSYSALCKNSKASDFYFAAQVYDEYTMVAIVPKEFFHTFGYMWDQHMPLDHILPDDMGEMMESVWDSERSVEEVRADLLARGFEENEKFTKLVAVAYD